MVSVKKPRNHKPLEQAGDRHASPPLHACISPRIGIDKEGATSVGESNIIEGTSKHGERNPASNYVVTWRKNGKLETQ